MKTVVAVLYAQLLHILTYGYLWHDAHLADYDDYHAENG